MGPGDVHPGCRSGFDYGVRRFDLLHRMLGAGRRWRRESACTAGEPFRLHSDPGTVFRRVGLHGCGHRGHGEPSAPVPWWSAASWCAAAVGTVRPRPSPALRSSNDRPEAHSSHVRRTELPVLGQRQAGRAQRAGRLPPGAGHGGRRHGRGRRLRRRPPPRRGGAALGLSLGDLVDVGGDGHGRGASGAHRALPAPDHPERGPRGGLARRVCLGAVPGPGAGQGARALHRHG